jgi:multidrug efflux pump subunit AcrB
MDGERIALLGTLDVEWAGLRVPRLGDLLIAGVASARVVGGVQRELTVELRREALQSTGVGVAQVVRALEAQNLAGPVGRVSGRFEERTIRLRGRFDRAEEFAAAVITQGPGPIVRLGDVADVRDGVEEPRSAAILNDADAVGIDVVKARGASTITVANDVRRVVEASRASLPPDVDLRIVRDAGARVQRSLHDVVGALIIGAALTVTIVFLFLNSWRSTVITAVALPISVLASFVAVWALGFTLNTMSLLGLSLAIGILIDDAIVVRENIVRHVEDGKNRWQAAHDGTDQIGLAVTATTFAIVAVFVPVAFMGGVAEQWFAPFALTIASSVLVSLLVSFSLDPMLSAYWADPRSHAGRRGPTTRALGRFNHWFGQQADRYKSLIGWALDHRWTMVALAVASFAAALALPALGIVGAQFFPAHDLSEFNIVIETPPGSSWSYTKLKAQEISRVARMRPDVAYTYTTIGDSVGLGPRIGAVNEGNIFVRLKPRTERERHQEDVERELRRELQRIGGVTVWVSHDPLTNIKQLQLQVRGPDADQLEQIGRQLAGILRQVPGAVDVGLSVPPDKPELDVHLDRALAGALGVTVGQVAQALRPAFGGVRAGHWVDPLGETRDVTVRLAPDARRGITDVESLPIPVMRPDRPETVPLEQIARIAHGLGPARIDHLNRQRVIFVQANTERRPLSDVVHDFNARIKTLAIPAGYDMSYGGERQDQRGVFRRILIALGIGLVLMYIVHVVQFGSFLDPLPVICSLPLSLIGAMLALVLTGSTLNIMSMIGLILLMGIVAKNAILLIDFAKAAERNGLDRRTAIIEAGRTRLRPILMTTFALVAGMVPVALGIGEGADFRAPLGRSVIGGVLTSTLLTLLVIPSVYDMLSDWRDRALARARRAMQIEPSIDDAASAWRSDLTHWGQTRQGESH